MEDQHSQQPPLRAPILRTQQIISNKKIKPIKAFEHHLGLQTATNTHQISTPATINDIASSKTSTTTKQQTYGHFEGSPQKQRTIVRTLEPPKRLFKSTPQAGKITRGSDVSKKGGGGVLVDRVTRAVETNEGQRAASLNIHLQERSAGSKVIEQMTRLTASANVVNHQHQRSGLKQIYPRNTNESILSDKVIASDHHAVAALHSSVTPQKRYPKSQAISIEYGSQADFAGAAGSPPQNQQQQRHKTTNQFNISMNTSMMPPPFPAGQFTHNSSFGGGGSNGFVSGAVQMMLPPQQSMHSGFNLTHNQLPGGFMTQTMLPPISGQQQATLGQTTQGQMMFAGGINQANTTTTTSLLDSTQMQLQQNLIGILQQKCTEIAAVADNEVSKATQLDLKLRQQQGHISQLETANQTLKEQSIQQKKLQRQQTKDIMTQQEKEDFAKLRLQVDQLQLESAQLKQRLTHEEESKRQWQDIAKQKDQHIKALQEQVQTVSSELQEERATNKPPPISPLLLSPSKKHSSLKKAASIENILTPKTVRFANETVEEDGDIDTFEARRKIPKGASFLLGDGNGS